MRNRPSTALVAAIATVLTKKFSEEPSRAAPADVGEDGRVKPWQERMADYYAGDGSKLARGAGYFKDQEIAGLRAQLAARGQGDPEADFDKWMEKRGPLGAGAVPERIFFAGWSAGNRAATPQPAAIQEHAEDDDSRDAERYNKMLREDYSVACDHARRNSVGTFEEYRKKRDDYYDEQEPV